MSKLLTADAQNLTKLHAASLDQLEDHGERCLVEKTSLGTHRAVADRRERAFDDIGGRRAYRAR